MVKKRLAGRPKKPPEQRRGTDIRIPVTESEKQAIQEAAQLATDDGELAGWARSVLLQAAAKTRKTR